LPNEEVTPPVTKIYLTIKPPSPSKAESFKKIKKIFPSSYPTNSASVACSNKFQ